MGKKITKDQQFYKTNGSHQELLVPTIKQIGQVSFQ